ncbi:MAG TPA: glycosyltransferase family 2 protein [Candidatus Krumholzibacteriaceae bacterium]|nr:glycosyltransferase family 2 protein [Candidatus Krumholzibacteriaceae bacterium]
MELSLKIVFVSLLSVMLYIYAGYPLILFVAGLFRKRSGTDKSYDLPTVALIISAHNESRIIRDKIENSLQLDYPEDKLQIVIASDASDDGTNEIVREYAGKNVYLKAFEKRSGKSATLNRALVGLEDDIIVFSDANAFYRRDAVSKLVRNFKDPDIGCVIGNLTYIDGKSNVGKGESLYWRYESFLNRLESRLKSVLVGTGTIFAIRRRLYRSVSVDIANDFQIPADILSQGFGVVYEPEAVATEKVSTLLTEEFKRKYRIIIRGLTGFGYLRKNFCGPGHIFQFVSRKLLRWWIGPILPVLYTVNLFLADEPLFLTLFILQSLFYLLAFTGLFIEGEAKQRKIIYIPFYFVMVNTAALFAIVTYISGRRFSVWDKAETTRDIQESLSDDRDAEILSARDSSSLSRDKEWSKRFEKTT